MRERLRLGIIGAGWIGSIRARAAVSSGQVSDIWVADVDREAAVGVAADVDARRAVVDYHDLLAPGLLDVVIISSAPETTHFPIARDCLRAGKHVLLEKPMALTVAEADQLIALADDAAVSFTVGYTQRFQPKFAYVKARCAEGSLGRLTSVLISRHITRDLGAKIASRGDLGPAQMEATHDIDLALWWLAPARPVRVYAQNLNGIMREPFGLPDCSWILVTMADGSGFTIGANWSLPLEAPGYSSVIAEVVGTDGAIFADDSHRDLLLSTTRAGLSRPLSTMPGERVGHVYQGPLEAETRHFLEAVRLGMAPLVRPEEARLTMELTLAADQSAQAGAPILL